MKLIKKLVVVGNGSLMVIINKDICKKLKLKEGDYIEMNLKKQII